MRRNIRLFTIGLFINVGMEGFVFHSLSILVNINWLFPTSAMIIIQPHHSLQGTILKTFNLRLHDSVCISIILYYLCWNRGMGFVHLFASGLITLRVTIISDSEPIDLKKINKYKLTHTQ